MSNSRYGSKVFLVAMLCTTVAWTACKKGGEEETEGPNACDDYFAAMEACLAKMPAEERGPMKKHLESQRQTLSKAGPALYREMIGTCETGLATLKSDPRCK